MIYFAQPIAGGPVKIGWAAHVPTRIRQLEAHYGQPLAILATMPGGYDEEQAVHARFAHLRFGRTEQFRPAQDLMAFIGRPLLVGANPDAVEAMDGREDTTAVIRVRVSGAYKDWLGRFAESERSDMSDLIDDALESHAKARGFELPPKR